MLRPFLSGFHQTVYSPLILLEFIETCACVVLLLCFCCVCVVFVLFLLCLCFICVFICLLFSLSPLVEISLDLCAQLFYSFSSQRQRSSLRGRINKEKVCSRHMYVYFLYLSWC